MKKKQRLPNKSSNTSKIKGVLTVMFLALSLGLALGIMQIPQDIRQHAQNTPGREPPPPPQCAASGAQPNTGVCIPTTEGCLPGEEEDQGQLDCATGQTCCALAEVPTECAAQSNGQTFCSTAANCTGLYNGMNLGQLDCGDGIICCKNPVFPTPSPTPTDAPDPTDPPEPTVPEDPTPTFGSISVPTEEPTEPPANDPTQAPDPQPQPQPQPQIPTDPGTQGGLLGLIIAILTLIFQLLGI